MKKSTLILWTFIPILTGYLVNSLLRVPVLGEIFFYVLTVATTAFWFWMGRQFEKSTFKTIPAILIGNATGIISLLIYLWQFLLVTSENRNAFLAGFSQMYNASVPGYLFGGIARLFETEPNYIGTRTFVALNVICEIYMIIVFVIGMVVEKKISKDAMENNNEETTHH